MGKTRWIDSTRAAAQAETTKLPWERGINRQRTLAKRLLAELSDGRITSPAITRPVSSRASRTHA